MNTPNGLYVVRLTYVDRHGTFYATDRFVDPRPNIIEANNMHLYMMSQAEAEQLYKSRTGLANPDVATIAIVKLARYSPFPEMLVSVFREFSHV